MKKAACITLLCLLGGSSLSLAAPFDEYNDSTSYSLALPSAASSYFTVYDSFPPTVQTTIFGHTLGRRILAATDRSIFLQNNFGSSQWLTVATIEETMDPSFLEISPGGTRVALGSGFYKPLYIFSPDVLDVQEPPRLVAGPHVKKFDANYYDAVWRDERYLFVNAASFGGESEVYAIDTSLDAPEQALISVIASIPGASGGVTFDHDGNLITGIGYGDDTGQLKIWPANQVTSALNGTPLIYEETGFVLANAMLSAASLGVDAEGNLFVGGGDVFGTTDNYGFAALIDHSVVTRVLAGGAPLNPEVSTEYRKLAPDPCENDDSVQVNFVEGLDMLVISTNLGSLPPHCEEVDWSGGGGETGPRMTLLFPEDALDTDGDGIPDGADNAYLTPNPEQTDTDGNGYGDAVDFDFDESGRIDAGDLSLLIGAFGATTNQSHFSSRYDLDADGDVDFADTETFLARWGTTAPWY